MFCENCGVRDGETDEQAWIRMGGDTAGASFDHIQFVVTTISWGRVCQMCRDFPGKEHFYNGYTGKAHASLEQLLRPL